MLKVWPTPQTSLRDHKPMPLRRASTDIFYLAIGGRRARVPPRTEKA